MATTANPSVTRPSRTQSAESPASRPTPSAANAANPSAYRTPATIEANHTTQPTTNATSIDRTFFANV